MAIIAPDTTEPTTMTGTRPRVSARRPLNGREIMAVSAKRDMINPL